MIDMGGASLSTASAIGRMLLTTMAGFAELERNLISDPLKSRWINSHRPWRTPTQEGIPWHNQTQ
jgi:DNA invertase Pin-like site-specific DNA recombinase